jgi:hypothetical protein
MTCAVAVAVSIVLLSEASVYEGYDRNSAILLVLSICIILACFLPLRPNLVRALLLMLMLFLLRPSLLADIFPYLALIPACSLLVLNQGLTDSVWKKCWAILISVPLAVIYPVLVSRPGDAAYLTVQAATALIVVVAVVSSPRPKAVTFAFIRVVAFVLAWQLCSFVLGLIADFKGLEVVAFQAGSRTGWAYSLLPGGGLAAMGPGFTSAWSYRMTAWLPEPGLLSALVAVLAVLSLALGLRERWLIVFLACGVLAAAQSLGGILALAGGIAIWALSLRRGSQPVAIRRLMSFLLAGAIVTVFVIVPDVALSSKANANAFSVSDRLGQGSIIDLLGRIVQHPFGTGSGGQNAEINLLQSALVNGIAIFVLWLVAYVVAPRAISRTALSDGPIFALFVTVLIAQPPFYEIFVMLLAVIASLGSSDFAPGTPSRLRSQGASSRQKIVRR